MVVLMGSGITHPGRKKGMTKKQEVFLEEVLSKKKTKGGKIKRTSSTSRGGGGGGGGGYREWRRRGKQMHKRDQCSVRSGGGRVERCGNRKMKISLRKGSFVQGQGRVGGVRLSIRWKGQGKGMDRQRIRGKRDAHL